MKHKIESINLSNFDVLWDDLMAKLTATGEVIVKSKITMTTKYSSLSCKYKAVVWTNHKNV